MAKDPNKAERRKVILVTSTITSLIMLIGFLAILFFQPRVAFLRHLGISDAFALVDPEQTLDSFSKDMVSELVKQGTLISLDDLWSYQTALYQTLISFLIAINGILAAVSIFYIRTSSLEKAEETAKTYIDSHEFKYKIQESIDKKYDQKYDLEKSQLSDILADLEIKTSNLQKVEDDVSRLTSDNDEIKRHLIIISRHISTNNTANDTQDLMLTKGEV